MAGSDITAYNYAQGSAAALIGPSRSRLQAVNIYAEAAGSFTLTNGNGGATLLVQKFPAGMNEDVHSGERYAVYVGSVCLCVYGVGNNELTILLA